MADARVIPQLNIREAAELAALPGECILDVSRRDTPLRQCPRADAIARVVSRLPTTGLHGRNVDFGAAGFSSGLSPAAGFAPSSRLTAFQTVSPLSLGEREAEAESFSELRREILELARHGVTLSRFKGLGEMNAHQLRETTMDPASRTLARVTLDDATSAICSAFLVEEEGTDSTFRALLDVFGRHGLPLSLYTDRGSHYFRTDEAGGKVDRCRQDVGARDARARRDAEYRAGRHDRQDAGPRFSVS